MASPGCGCSVFGGIDDRRERPEDEGEVGEGEVGPEDTLRAGAGENLFEELAHLLACLGELPFAGGVAHEDLLEHAVAALELERGFEEADESGPGVWLGERVLGEGEELADALGDDCFDECFPGGEVAVEGAGADAGAARYLVEAGVYALFGEDLARGGDEESVVALRVAPRSGRASRRLSHACDASKNGGHVRFC